MKTKVTTMTTSEIVKAMHEQRPVRVSGNDGIFAIMEVNLMLKVVGLVKLTDDNSIPTTMAKFEDIKVIDDDQG